MLYETKEIELSEGLETAETIVSVNSGMNHRLKIPVINNSKHDKFLPKNTISRFQTLHLYRLKRQKQPSRDVLRKRCSENMQQIYRRTPMPKCDFN